MGRYCVLLLGVVFLSVALVAYLIKFGGWPWWDYFSNDREHWGQFGDFLGGLLNPLIGLITIWLFTKSLYQNSEMLEASREELRLSREEIVRGISVQNDARLALERELGVIENNRIKSELEAVIKHYEYELDRLASFSITPPVVVTELTFGEIESTAYYSLHELEKDGYVKKRLQDAVVDQRNNANLLAIRLDAFHVIDQLSRATGQLLNCIETDLYRIYWSERFLKSANRVYDWGAFDSDRWNSYLAQFGGDSHE